MRYEERFSFILASCLATSGNTEREQARFSDRETKRGHEGSCEMRQGLFRITAMCYVVIMCGCVSVRFQAGTDEFGGFRRLEKKYCIENIDFSVDFAVNAAHLHDTQERVLINAPAANNMPWLAYQQSPRKFISGVMRQMPDVFSNDPDAEKISLSCRITSAYREESIFPFIITWGFLFPMTGSYEFSCGVSVANAQTDNTPSHTVEYRTKVADWIGEPWTLVCYFANPPASPEYSESCVCNIVPGDIASKEESIMYRTFAKAVLCAIERDVSASKPSKPASTYSTPTSTPATLDKLKSLRDSGVITQQEFLDLTERAIKTDTP